MNRRDFLRFLLATPIAATVDVEALLWVPKPIIVVPAMPVRLHITLAEMHEILKAVYLPSVRELLNNQTVLLRYLEGSIR